MKLRLRTTTGRFPYRTNIKPRSRRLWPFDPAAIFFDLSYMRAHGEDREAHVAELRDRPLAITANGGPPVYIGEVGDLQSQSALPPDQHRNPLNTLQKSLQHVTGEQQ